MSEQDLSPDEMQELQEYIGANAPTREENAGIFNFFNKILKTSDTIKVSNLDVQELPSVRMLRSTSNYADIMGLTLVSQFLSEEAEVILGSALSKQGFLIERAITSKKENKIRTRTGEAGKGWTLFGKKKEEQE